MAVCARVLIASGMALGLAAPARGADSGGALPPELIVLPGAEKVSSSPVSGISGGPLSVRYELRTPYPAAAVIDQIRTKLEAAGWKGLPREGLSPLYPSALRTGWRNHVNTTTKPTQSFVWNARWRDAEGDVVEYTLMYLSHTPSPEGQAAKPDNDTLRVDANLRRRFLLRLEELPPSLIVLAGAKDVGAWRSMDEQRLGYDLTAPRPPSEAMKAISERLEKQGWKSIAEPPPPLFPAEKWEQTHKTGWNFGTSGGFGGHLEWRATWRNDAGSTVRYMLTYAGTLPAGIREDPEHGVTSYYVQAELNPSGQGRVVVFPPSGPPTIRSVPPPPNRP